MFKKLLLIGLTIGLTTLTLLPANAYGYYRGYERPYYHPVINRPAIGIGINIGIPTPIVPINVNVGSVYQPVYPVYPTDAYNVNRWQMCTNESRTARLSGNIVVARAYAQDALNVAVILEQEGLGSSYYYSSVSELQSLGY